MSPDSPFTDDMLLGGRVVVRQPVNGYRAAIDPILLAAAVNVQGKKKVLDVGCGSGAAMFCLAARVPGLDCTGLELQPAIVEYARAGIELNNLENRAHILEGDIAMSPTELRNTFDIVLTNPPYSNAGRLPSNISRATAHMESNIDLASWITACLACLKLKGRFIIIHRAGRLSDILAALHGKAGDVHIFPIVSRFGEVAQRVIVDAGKGRQSPDTLKPSFVLHDSEGRYTLEAEQVLRDAQPLPI